MEEPGFFALHTAFQTQYEELSEGLRRLLPACRGLSREAFRRFSDPLERPPPRLEAWPGKENALKCPIDKTAKHPYNCLHEKP